MEFFLANWSEIKSSETMRNVFQQVRLGRHPGFGMYRFLDLELGVLISLLILNDDNFNRGRLVTSRISSTYISLTQIISQVWPLIIMNLEFVPRPLPEAGVDAAKDILSA